MSEISTYASGGVVAGAAAIALSCESVFPLGRWLQMQAGLQLPRWEQIAIDFTREEP